MKTQMSNLTLVATEKFNLLPISFYKNDKSQILLTRKQIGEALEYKDPEKSISNIHARHKDRLNKYSVTLKLTSTDGKRYDTTLYTIKGVLEICRWSSKPKANRFMNWCYDVVEKYNDLSTQQTITYKESEYLIQVKDEIIEDLHREIELLNNKIDNLIHSSSFKVPTLYYSKWKQKANDRIAFLHEFVNQQSKNQKSIDSIKMSIFKRIEDTYNIDLDSYIVPYKESCNVRETEIDILDVIESNDQLREMFQFTLSNIYNLFNLKYPTKEIDIFTELSRRQKGKY